MPEPFEPIRTDLRSAHRLDTARNRKERAIYRLIISLSLSVILFGQFAYGLDSQASSAARTGPVPGRFVVKLTETAKTASVNQALSGQAYLSPIIPLADNSDIVGREGWNRIFQITTSDTSISIESLTDLIGRDRIEFIEPDYYLEFYDLPTDPLFSHQWYLNNTGQEYTGVAQVGGSGNDYQTLLEGLAGIDVNLTELLLSPPTDTTPIVVAVIDGGVDLFHPEMLGRLWQNPDEIPFNGLDDDHNGLVDDTVGWDFSGDVADILNIQPDNDPSDFDGHGSHIAGIIASKADGQGIVGIAPWVEILPVKTRPNSISSVGASGIVYSVSSGARVINISWGTPFESLILKEAVDFARANGVFIAIAAGNSGDNQRVYPAAFDSSFAVGAITSNGYLTSFSTWGAHVDLAAPGLDILSIRADGTDLYTDGGEPGVHIVHGEENDSLYFLANGTSMAAPMVAGAAALIWSFRPDLSLTELEDALRLGGDDMLDPLNQGDNYVGVDTIAGYGMLNIQNSLEYISYGSVHFVTPLRNQRYESSVEIRIAPSGGYLGSWRLQYSLGRDPNSWLTLASGAAVPSDSVAYLFDLAGVNDRVNLKLIDSLFRETSLSFYYVTEDAFLITAPKSGDQFKYDMNFSGSVFGPTYDSLAIYYRNGGQTEIRITGSSQEFFDEHIYTWNISGVASGSYDLVIYGYFGETVNEITIPIDILSSYTAGWPQPLSGRGAYTAVAADLNNDGFKELFVGTVMGLNGFSYDGQPLAGFPVLPEMNMRNVPAIYDIDGDGEKEIICTNENGLHAFNYDGSYVTGFPRPGPSNQLNHGWPVVSVTKLGERADSALAYISYDGNIFAYKFNGDSYFYSLEGWYSSLTPIESNPFFNSSVTLSSADLTGNGKIEVVATYSGSLGSSGVNLLIGRNGQPAFDQPSPLLFNSPGIFGTLLADMDGDGLLEIVINGADENGDHALFVIGHGKNMLSGWPVSLPGTADWLSAPATVADLDLDGSPEIILSLHEFDIGSVYIFKADGTPYITRDGRPAGEVFFEPVTLGPPIVADLLGDSHPEIVLRSGFILPGSGPEQIHLLDYTGEPVPGWPISTATSPSTTFSTPFAPLVDDIDNDGLVELILVGEGNDLYVWDFQASSNQGANLGRLYQDNRNSNIVRLPSQSASPLTADSKAGANR